MLKLQPKEFQKKIMDYIYLKTSLKDQITKIDLSLRPVHLKPGHKPEHECWFELEELRNPDLRMIRESYIKLSQKYKNEIDQSPAELHLMENCKIPKQNAIDKALEKAAAQEKRRSAISFKK